MNLNEAAEIWKGEKPAGLLEVSEARSILVCTILSELDPAPISEEWLRENGGKQNGWKWHFGKLSIEQSNYYQAWEVNAMRPRLPIGKWYITTLGELRTLLRLAGAREKETDA